MFPALYWAQHPYNTTGGQDQLPSTLAPVATLMGRLGSVAMIPLVG